MAQRAEIVGVFIPAGDRKQAHKMLATRWITRT